MNQELINHDKLINEGSLGRHETFTPRYGWLKKGYEAVDKHKNDFKANDAIERLGVGKNMVSSIRYWSQAFKLLKTNGRDMCRTELGDTLLDTQNGWDPYLEDIASLWLLHWQLFIPPLDTVSWVLAFNKCNLKSFDIDLLGSTIGNAAQKYDRFASISEETFHRDASCIIRMYVEQPSDKGSEIECPFTQLGIMQHADQRHHVYFDATEKQNLPALIFAATCFSYIHHYLPPSQRTVSIQKLTYDFNSPGVAFKLPESSVGSVLNTALKKFAGVELQDGLEGPQLYFSKKASDLYWDALEKYYKEQV